MAQAAATLEAHGAPAALGLLDALGADDMAAYQPYWAVRANALARVDRLAEARDAYRRALGLSVDPAVRAFLAGQLDALEDA